MRPAVILGPELIGIIDGSLATLAQIDIKERERLRIAADTIRPILEKSIARLQESDWPSHDFAAYHIRIVRGDRVTTVSVPALHREGPLRIAGREPLRVEIGVDIFASGAGQSLGKGRFPPADVAAALLAHEIFHLTEMGRMSASGVRLGTNVSPFATGLHPEMSGEWKGAALGLAESFNIKRGPADFPALAPLGIWKAADLASEACADLQSLQIIRRAGLDLRAWTAALIVLRRSQEAQATKGVAAVDCFVVDPPYQLGAAIKSLRLLSQQDDTWPIRAATWRLAFKAAQAESRHLSPETTELITQALSNLVRKNPAPRGLFGLGRGKRP